MRKPAGVNRRVKCGSIYVLHGCMAQAPQNREATTDCGGGTCALPRTHWLTWSDVMRAVFALGFACFSLGVLIALCAPADAARMRHPEPYGGHLHPAQPVAALKGFAVPGWTEQQTRGLAGQLPWRNGLTHGVSAGGEQIPDEPSLIIRTGKRVGATNRGHANCPHHTPAHHSPVHHCDFQCR